jgi:hypothetical protein
MRLQRRCIDGHWEERRRCWGEHPSTLTSVGDLARVLRDQGRYEEAEEMNRQALDRRGKVNLSLKTRRRESRDGERSTSEVSTEGMPSPQIRETLLKIFNFLLILTIPCRSPAPWLCSVAGYPIRLSLRWKWRLTLPVSSNVETLVSVCGCSIPSSRNEG